MTELGTQQQRSRVFFKHSMYNNGLPPDTKKNEDAWFAGKWMQLEKSYYTN